MSVNSNPMRWRSFLLIICVLLSFALENVASSPLGRELHSTDVNADTCSFVRGKRNSQYIHPIEKCIPENKTMIIRDFKVNICQIFQAEAPRYPKCKGIETIEIFASESITIDCSLTAHNLTLVLMAPELILTGHSYFDLNGKNGQSKDWFLPPGDHKNPNGTDGEPGGMGENGGNFIGIFDKVTDKGVSGDPRVLTISANGGDGGAGQPGGRGFSGKSVTWLTVQDFDVPYPQIMEKATQCESSQLSPFPSLYKVATCTIYGSRGSRGGRGADGGAGGFGGFPGFINVTIRNGDPTQAVTVIPPRKGNTGKNGHGGEGGEGGKHSVGLVCTWYEFSGGYLKYWDKKNCEYLPVSDLYADTGDNGKAGGNILGLRQPNPPNFHEEDFSYLEQNFQLFMEENTK